MAATVTILKNPPQQKSNHCTLVFDANHSNGLACECGFTPSRLTAYKTDTIRYWMAGMGQKYILLTDDGTFIMVGGSDDVVRPIDTQVPLTNTLEAGASAGFVLLGGFIDANTTVICWR